MKRHNFKVETNRKENRSVTVLTSMAGMYLGARCQKFVPAKAIKWMLAGIITATALKYIAAFFGY